MLNQGSEVGELRKRVSSDDSSKAGLLMGMESVFSGSGGSLGEGRLEV